MHILYFLAHPLSEQDTLRLRSPRYRTFVNNSLYMSLIAHQGTLYLAKQLPTFPCTIDTWEEHLSHVYSLLKHTFLLAHPHPVLLAYVKTPASTL